MASVKEQMIKIIQEQPEDSSYEKIIREIAFLKTVERGIEDSEKGNTISNEEMIRRISTWQK